MSTPRTTRQLPSCVLSDSVGQDQPLLESFAPVADASARVLILGSMPGEKSLQMQQYYAHPRNLFWPIMAELLSFDAQLPYPERTRQLVSNQIALWDVLQHCHRPGSLDSNIANHSMVANDFAGFFKANPSIRQVYFNGKKAEAVFRKLVLPSLAERGDCLRLTGLPSTSPANASISLTQKKKAWQQVVSST